MLNRLSRGRCAIAGSDITAPQVTILTEATGMSPQEVEALVSFPIESSINGAANVTAVRSSSAVGLSIVTVTFGYGTNIYITRQLVAAGRTRRPAAARHGRGHRAPRYQ